MIWGKVERVIVTEIYDEEGKFLGKQAKYTYKPLLMWYEVAIGLFLAFLVLTQVI